MNPRYNALDYLLICIIGILIVSLFFVCDHLKAQRKIEMARRNYLEVEPKANSFFGLVDNSDVNDFDIDLPPSDFKGITPKPGFCVKVKTDNNEKVFINLCHSADVPPPPPSLDVYKIMASGSSDEESLFRFPLSLGELHTELDKSGNECKCYDVVINSDYYQEISKNSALRDFIMTLACSGIERKYDISLDVGTCTILNKPYHGKMPLHYIRLKPNASPNLPSLDEAIRRQDEIIMPVKEPSLLISRTGPEVTRYDLFQTPATGSPSLLIFQGLTANVKNKSSLTVFLSKSTLTVRDIKCKPLLSISLPYEIIPQKSLSNFWKGKLFVVMPVNSCDS